MCSTDLKRRWQWCALLVVSLVALANSQQIEFFSRDGQIWANETPFSIKGVTWEGFEKSYYVADGLNAASANTIISTIVQSGFNTVKFPLSYEFILFPNVPFPAAVNVALNPDLDPTRALTSLDVLKILVQKLATQNIMVVFSAARLSSTADGKYTNSISDLWHDEDWGEDRVFNFWTTLTAQFCDQWNVMGVDLKDQLHGTARWGPSSDSVGNVNWQDAAKRIGNHVYFRCTRWLLFVQGISNPSSDESYWWGSDLRGVRNLPAQLDVADKIVYAVNVWPPSVVQQGRFNQTAYFLDPAFPDNLPALWDYQFGWIPKETGNALVISNWGANFGDSYVNVATRYAADALWIQTFVDYLTRRNFACGFTRLNPNAPIGGIINSDWQTPVSAKVNLLKAFFTEDPVAYIDAGKLTTKRLTFDLLIDVASVDPENTYSKGLINYRGAFMTKRLAVQLNKKESYAHLSSMKPSSYIATFIMDFVEGAGDTPITTVAQVLRTASLQNISDVTGVTVKAFIPPNDLVLFPTQTPLPTVPPAVGPPANTFAPRPTNPVLGRATPIPIISIEVINCDPGASMRLMAIGLGSAGGGALLALFVWFLCTNDKTTQGSMKTDIFDGTNGNEMQVQAQETMVTASGDVITLSSATPTALYPGMQLQQQQNGLYLDPSGYYVDGNGNYVDENGNIISAEEETRSPSRASVYSTADGAPASIYSPSRAMEYQPTAAPSASPYPGTPRQYNNASRASSYVPQGGMLGSYTMENQVPETQQQVRNSPSRMSVFSRPGSQMQQQAPPAERSMPLQQISYMPSPNGMQNFSGGDAMAASPYLSSSIQGMGIQPITNPRSDSPFRSSSRASQMSMWQPPHPSEYSGNQYGGM